MSLTEDARSRRRIRERIMSAWVDGWHAGGAPARERRTDLGKLGCANRFEGEYPMYAAAPDLLAALEALVAWHESERQHTQPVESRLVLARAAIERAHAPD